MLNGLSPDLTFRFFAILTRMEFSLKRLRLPRFAAEAQVGQPRLVARLRAGFFAVVQAAQVAETPIAIPPKHFIVAVCVALDV